MGVPHVRSDAGPASYSAPASLAQTPAALSLKSTGQGPISKLTHSYCTAAANPDVSSALADVSAVLWRAFVRSEMADAAGDGSAVRP